MCVCWKPAHKPKARKAKSRLASAQLAGSAGRVKEAAPLLDEPEAHRLVENGFGCEQLRERAYRIRPAASVPVCRHKSRRNLGSLRADEGIRRWLLADGRNLLSSSSCNFGRRESQPSQPNLLPKLTDSKGSGTWKGNAKMLRQEGRCARCFATAPTQPRKGLHQPERGKGATQVLPAFLQRP